ncbi:aspartate kinase [Oxalobacteraceae bacterium GrIS 1.11]
MEQAVISGITFKRDEAKITVFGVHDGPGMAYRILGPVAAAKIGVDMIIQSRSAEGNSDITFTVAGNEYARAMLVLNDSVRHEIGTARIIGITSVSKLSILGVGMRSNVGVASRMFRTLSEQGINILMISTSEIKISVLIDEQHIDLALGAVRKEFQLESIGAS